MLRKIEALPEGYNRKLVRNPIPPPPKIAWLRLDQLVIDETYQRDLSFKSRALIRRLVEGWDWNCFKPLSVALAANGAYEVIDGQHTAIAAATHGAIETLPCLVLDAATLAERSKAFVGINRDRVALTAYALFRARLAAEDPEAVAVQAALSATGATLIEAIMNRVEYEQAGVMSCVSTLLQVVRRGGKGRLTRILKICTAASVSPIPAMLIKGLDATISGGSAPSDEALTATLTAIGDEELLQRARAKAARGEAADGATALRLVLIDSTARLADAA